jgi:RNA polymerase sigma-70 factor (ECF subfamily)
MTLKLNDNVDRPGLSEVQAEGRHHHSMRANRRSIPNTMTNEKIFFTNSRTSAADTRAEFESLFLPHLDAACNLARLLTRNPHDAEDVVQESYLRALRAFSSFRGGASRPWFLTIVRNTSFTWMRDNRSRADHAEYHEELHASGGATPEAEALGQERARALERCVQELPSDFREAIVLREMEELCYQEIAEITGVPRGTVMSRLSRARARLAECLMRCRGTGSCPISS